jgi:hypothetical protein
VEVEVQLDQAPWAVEVRHTSQQARAEDHPQKPRVTSALAERQILEAEVQRSLAPGDLAERQMRAEVQTLQVLLAVAARIQVQVEVVRQTLGGPEVVRQTLVGPEVALLVDVAMKRLPSAA